MDRLKWLLVAGLWLVLAGAASGFGPPSLGTGEPFGQSYTSADLATMQAAPVVPPAVRSVAAIAVDADTGLTIASRNADAHLAEASLTKMMTALVALDRAQLTDVITATERSRSEPSIIGLDPGDKLSLEDMLYGLLLPSGNDAALAIAETVGGGSIDRFVGWMNERAASMGLHNTHYANPHGLDQEGHYTSARDQAIVARAFMAEPTLARIVATPNHVVPGPPLYGFRTSNPLLGVYPGADGIKTGFTDDAGRCLASTAVRDGRRIITIVLNSPNIASDSISLLDAAFAMSTPKAIEVPRPGFAGVRMVASGERSVDLVGWELPLLRAYADSGTSRASLKLAGHAIR
jgi:serine-type D-Ala-D-Ala carboxypeptidase (penicillin-binding protein 5/6)